MTDIENIILEKLDNIEQKQDRIHEIAIKNQERSLNNELNIKKIFNRTWAMFVLIAGSIGSGIFAHFK